MTLGSMGIPGITGSQPAAIRRAENQINTLIDTYNPGRVEFRELEVLEPEDQ